MHAPEEAANRGKGANKKRRDGAEGWICAYPATRQKCGTEFAGFLFILFPSFFSLQIARMHHARIPGSRLQGSQSSGNDGLHGEEEKRKRATCIAEGYAHNAIYSPVSVREEAPCPPLTHLSSILRREKLSPLSPRFSCGRIGRVCFASSLPTCAYPRYISTGFRHPDPEIHLEVSLKSTGYRELRGNRGLFQLWRLSTA